jgi:hypothetical protein
MAGRESKENRVEADFMMEALIEGARVGPLLLLLPPRNHIEEGQHPPFGAAPKRQTGEARQGLICGDAQLRPPRLP